MVDSFHNILAQIFIYGEKLHLAFIYEKSIFFLYYI